MSFRQSKSLKHVPLPIAGHSLVQIDNEYLISLTFASPGGVHSVLRFEYEVILTELDGSTKVITATKPGLTFDPDADYEALSPLLEKAVTAAFAHANGQLELTFEEGISLQVHPDNYEAWHFQQPAPYSSKRYSYKQHVSCTGYGGGLIRFGFTR
jgi:Family of unknown function (DUF6188)